MPYANLDAVSSHVPSSSSSWPTANMKEEHILYYYDTSLSRIPAIISPEYFHISWSTTASVMAWAQSKLSKRKQGADDGGEMSAKGWKCWVEVTDGKDILLVCLGKLV